MKLDPSDDEARAALYNSACCYTKLKQWQLAVDATVSAVNDYDLKLSVAVKARHSSRSYTILHGDHLVTSPETEVFIQRACRKCVQGMSAGTVHSTVSSLKVLAFQLSQPYPASIRALLVHRIVGLGIWMKFGRFLNPRLLLKTQSVT